jgi:hypothetical protein
MNDANLDNMQHHLLRRSDAEPNCRIEGVQGHWIKDILNPPTDLPQVMMFDAAEYCSPTYTLPGKSCSAQSSVLDLSGYC